jgi:hypothetical protein
VFRYHAAQKVYVCRRKKLFMTPTEMLLYDVHHALKAPPSCTDRLLNSAVVAQVR